MCRAKKEENNGAAPLRSVSGEVFATFASLLLVALVLMCMLQTGLSCAYFAQERKSALTAVLDGATAMAETYASEGNIVTLPGGDNELVERAKTGFELFNTSSDALVFVADRDGNILMHTGKDVAESAKIPQNLQEEMDSGKPGGTIVWQSPASGETVPEWTTIKFRVSAGLASSALPIMVDIPQNGKDIVKVEIYVGDEPNPQYSETVYEADGAVSTTLYGTGRKMVKVYFDGVLDQKQSYERSFG